MKISYTRHPYTALRIDGQDCWARDVAIEETMNSVSVGGRRISLTRFGKPHRAQRGRVQARGVLS